MTALAVCLPALLVPMPPLLDYPNHFARLWLLAGGGSAGPLAQVYGVDWTGASVNIGIDIGAFVLGPWMGPNTLPPLFLAVACVLPPLGAVLLNRAVFGGWHWWQCGFTLLVWCFTLLAGFLNFQISLGLALLGAAADPAMARLRGLPLIRMAVGAVVLVCHPFGCLFYGTLLAGLAFGRPVQGALWPPPPFERLWRAGVAGACGTLVPLTGLWLLAPVLPGGHAESPMYERWGGDFILNKLLVAASLVVTYDPLIDVGFLVALWFVLRVLIGMRRGSGHAGLLIGAAALAALALVVPSALADNAYIDSRLPIMAALMAAAGWRPGQRASPGLAACALLVLGLARTGWIATVWDARQADMRSVARALAPVPAGAAVLPAEHCCAAGPVGRRLLVTTPTYLHDPALAVPWRQAFVPNLFAAPGKQPLRVRPPWNSLTVAEGPVAPLSMLLTYTPTPVNKVFFGYLAHWRERFDYVLVVNADTPDDKADEAAIDALALVADEGFARLYRVRQP